MMFSISKERIIVPILVPTAYKKTSRIVQMSVYDDKVVNPLISGRSHLSDLITSVLNRFPDEDPIDNNWIISPYAPTPTIIEAARTLYENHSVENIIRHEADDVYTGRTINMFLKLYKRAKRSLRKAYAL